MRTRGFGAYYAALGLLPGVTDEEIARVKRAYNELYHSDRLAHMSDQARAIAAEKVRAANEAAQALLDPANRAARDSWVLSSRNGSHPEPDVAPEPEPAAAEPPLRDREWPPWPVSSPAPRRVSTRRLVGIGLAAGVFLGTLAVALQRPVGRVAAAPAAPDSQFVADSVSGPITVAGSTRPAPTPIRPQPVVDSVLTLRGDGRWTRPVAAGGPAFRVSFLPESDAALFRVRSDRQQQVLLGEPAFSDVLEPAPSYQLSSLTGQPLRIRFTRWRPAAGPGRTIHRKVLTVPGDGSWSSKLYFGQLNVRWEPDRAAGYEARDQHGRISHIPAGLTAIHFAAIPEWVRFRSTDGLPLTLAVEYRSR